MTRLSHFSIAIVLAALVVYVFAELPPVVITCQSKELIEEDLPFYDENSYEDIETVVFDYESTEAVEWPFIYPLFATATFVVENKGDEDLTFAYTSKVSNLTDNGADTPSYMLQPSEETSVVPAHGSVDFVFGYQSVYNAKDAFSGMLTVFMLFKGLSTTYDPVSFKASSELYVTGCSSECSDKDRGKGTCIERIGYCACEEPWTGFTCQSGLKVSKTELCPGEPINISYSFAYATCKGYWSIYDAEEESTTFGSGTMASEDCVKDSLIKEKDFTIIIYLEPGEYSLVYYREYGVSEDGRIYLTVKDWGECGDQEYDCSEDEENPCSGHGECNEHKCECEESHFWQNCSRGCSLETRLTATTGVIDSDSGSEAENKYPLYIPQTNCTWYIEPEGTVDKIRLDFTRFSFHSPSDVLWVRSLNREGKIDKNSIVLGKFSGTSIPQSKEIPETKIALVFTTNYQGSSLGFRLTYTAVHDPFGGVAIAHVVVVGFVVIVGLIVLLFYVFSRRKTRRIEALKFAKAALSEPWELTPDEEEIVKVDRDIGKDGVMPERFELEKILGWADMKDIEFECSEYDLRFGLEDRVPFPVMVEQKQKILQKLIIRKLR